MSDKARLEFEAKFPKPDGVFWNWEFEGYDELRATIGDAYYARYEAWLAAKEKYEPRWLPIETAPKDCSEFLVCNMRQMGVRTLIRWCNTHNIWLEKGKWYHMQATHWMPLPTPPSTQGGGE